jgi:hypothetical protein
MRKELTAKEIELIEAIRNEPNKTKGNLLKLNKIFNASTGATHLYCLCDAKERAVFHSFFFRWYDKKSN